MFFSLPLVQLSALMLDTTTRLRTTGKGWGSSSCLKAAFSLQSAGPAVLDRPVVERAREAAPVKERKGMGNESWEVRIYNDGLNTREHVARSLVQVTGLSELQAYQTMMQAHQNGIAVVGRWVYEVAEMFHDALKKKGIVCDIVPVGGDE